VPANRAVAAICDRFAKGNAYVLMCHAAIMHVLYANFSAKFIRLLSPFKLLKINYLQLGMAIINLKK